MRARGAGDMSLWLFCVF